MSYFCEAAMPLTVKEKIQAQLDASADKAFVRREFADQGAYRQVSRALAELVAEGKLVRAGKGVWVPTRTRPSRLLGQEGKLITTPVTDVVSAALVALRKLGYDVGRNSLEEARLRGETTQIPMVPMIRVKGRTRRKLAVGGEDLIYESNKPRA